MRRQSRLQSGGVLDECRDIRDLARKQFIEQLVLHQKNGIFLLGQPYGKSRFACGHLAAQEDQFRWGMALNQKVTT